MMTAQKAAREMKTELAANRLTPEAVLGNVLRDAETEECIQRVSTKLEGNERDSRLAWPLYFCQNFKNSPMKEAEALNGVAAFHRAFKLPVLDSPTIPDKDRCALRINLLQEELDELKEAIADNDIVAAADAFCDIQYVLSGAILEFGLGEKFADLFAEVQRSNMSKICDTRDIAEETVAFYKNEKDTEGYISPDNGAFLVYRKTDHKVLKSINYSPADLESILDQK
jgi:predicted HAD superfamily Cof-like phosphohydrolase